MTFKNKVFNFLLLNLLLTFSSFIISQELEPCNIVSSFSSNHGGIFSTEEIPNKEFDTLLKKEYKLSKEFEIQFFQNSDEAEKLLVSQYPEVFQNTNNGYDFRTIDNDTLSARNIKGVGTYDRRVTTYKFKGRLKNYIIISWMAYEDWGHLIVDIKNNFTYNFPGQPKFISHNRVYAHTNYYGATTMKFANLETGKDLTVNYHNTRVLKVIELPNENIVFKLKRDDCDFSINKKFELFQL